MQPKSHFTSFVVASQKGVTKIYDVFSVIALCTLKSRMTGSKFSARDKVTRSFWAVFGRAVFIGTEQNASGGVSKGVLGVFGFET